mgnify:CR=1 FL=1
MEENGIPYTDRHIVEQNPTVEELKEWHTRSGRELKRFFNTSGLLYKSMHLKEKLPKMSPEEQFELLATNGMLVKRPLLVGDDFVLIGFVPRNGNLEGGTRMTEVAAAILRRDGKILICQRKEGGNCSLLWESPAANGRPGKPWSSVWSGNAKRSWGS